MNGPIAVFDAGIGSYAIVAEIQRRLPKQDIIYFADRASFPYGSKGQQELLSIMRKTITFLESHSPSAIVVASNAPSIMVLDEIKQFSNVPMFGIYPPLEKALSASVSGHVGIMGVHSLVKSAAMERFVNRHNTSQSNITMINASPMVELVETGSFLFNPADTQAAVTAFVNKILQQNPSIDVLTLSSTHLPWLRQFFEVSCPECQFLDPAEDIVASMGLGHIGTGRVRGLVTNDNKYDLNSFRQMLEKIGVKIPLELVPCFG
jgi:glutamate racemase